VRSKEERRHLFNNTKEKTLKKTKRSRKRFKKKVAHVEVQDEATDGFKTGNPGGPEKGYANLSTRE